MKRIIIVVLVLLCSMCFAYAQGASEVKSNSLTLELRQDQTFVETIYFQSHKKTVVYSHSMRHLPWSVSLFFLSGWRT